MLIRVYSLKYGKYLWEQGCAKKLVNFFWQKVYLSIWMCPFRIWPLAAVIVQAKVQLIITKKVVV